MRIFYECNPIRDLRVIPAANIITRACLAPCFLDGLSHSSPIPCLAKHGIANMEPFLTDSMFGRGNSKEKGRQGRTLRGRKLYELNVWAMIFGRAKERTVSVPDDELAARQARKKGKPGSAC